MVSSSCITTILILNYHHRYHHHYHYHYHYHHFLWPDWRTHTRCRSGCRPCSSSGCPGSSTCPGQGQHCVGKYRQSRSADLPNKSFRYTNIFSVETKCSLRSIDFISTSLFISGLERKSLGRQSWWPTRWRSWTWRRPPPSLCSPTSWTWMMTSAAPLYPPRPQFTTQATWLVTRMQGLSGLSAVCSNIENLSTRFNPFNFQKHQWSRKDSRSGWKVLIICCVVVRGQADVAVLCALLITHDLTMRPRK